MADSRLLFDILARDRASGTFNKVGGSADGLASKLSSVGKVAATAIAGAGVAAVAGLGAAMFQGVKDAVSYETITKQLAATLKATGNAAGTSVKDMQDLAGSLESLSGVDEELILNSQNVLATFKNISNNGPGSTFDAATKAALNLSTTMGGDLQGATVLVGKALNDPLKGLTALGRAGVSFTQGQKDMIKALVESGDTMGAQKIILGELEGQFGGAAKAAGSGFAGDLARLKDAFSDAFREVGQKILPYLADLASWLSQRLPAAIDAVGRVLGKVADQVSLFWNALRTGFTEDEGTPIERFALMLRENVLPVIRDLVEWIGNNLTTVLKVAVGAVILFGGPITALVAGFIALYTQSSAFRDIIGKVADFITGTVVPGVEKLIAVFKEDGLGGALAFVGTAITDFLPVLGEKVGKLAAAFIRWVTDSVPPLLRELGKWIGALLTWLVETGIPKAIEGLVKMAAEFVKWVAPAIPPLLLELGKLLLGITTWIVTDALPKLVTEIAKWGLEFIKWVGPAALDLIVELGKLYLKMQEWIWLEALPKIVTALLKWAGAFIGWVWTAVRDLPGNLATLLTNILNWAKDVPGKIIEKLGALADMLWDAFLDLGGKAADAFISGLGNIAGRVADKVTPGDGGGLLDFLPAIPRPRFSAAGVRNFSGGWSWVGEQGPELMHLPRGTDIYSNPDSMAMGGEVHLVIDVDRDGRIERVYDGPAPPSGQRVRALVRSA